MNNTSANYLNHNASKKAKMASNISSDCVQKETGKVKDTGDAGDIGEIEQQAKSTTGDGCVEVGLLCHSKLSMEDVEEIVFHELSFLKRDGQVTNVALHRACMENKRLSGHVGHLHVTKNVSDEPSVFVYRLFMDGAVEKCTNLGDGENDESDGSVSSTRQWVLPAWEFREFWDSLVYDSSIKEDLLRFAATTMLFSDHAVNSTIISWNRVLLLHGPPGTGKTSLCKALAQKLSIRFSRRYTHGRLIEINSHSLFSKWFSESGKLVGKMFEDVRRVVEREDSFVFILIDEVESIAVARQSLSNGTEPSDSVRVVNALLTQIDQLSRYNNILIMTTSNMSGHIDVAFVDRADLKLFVDVPGLEARYLILCSCVEELCRSGIIISDILLLDFSSLEAMEFTESEATRSSLRLIEVARECEGFSGRILRKLPCIAFSLLVQKGNDGETTKDELLGAMLLAAQQEQAQRQLLSQNHLLKSKG
eukprot:m.50843 g.50843  ORF g.50843 m.50843 type:complete len:478 (-) comp10916_c0_seq2:103-1536(-)